MNDAFSPCAIAMLAAIAHSEQLTVDQIRRQVPWNEPSMLTPDVGAWFDRLQDLLDADLVRRVPVADGYMYRPTSRVLVIAVALSSRPRRKGMAAA
ncbi:MAG: hypothetical protein ACXW5U_19975 [Thermoanaerobaculia bacterium]